MHFIFLKASIRIYDSDKDTGVFVIYSEPFPELSEFIKADKLKRVDL